MREAPTPQEANVEADIRYFTDGMFYTHNCPCPICHQQKAVMETNRMYFSPCWKCQSQGWETRQRGATIRLLKSIMQRKDRR